MNHTDQPVNKTTISTRDDIKLLVDTFYQRAIVSKEIGFFFTEIAKLDLQKHMPVMYDFWETTLLGNMKYKGNPMIKHLELSNKSRLERSHFDEWIYLWNITIDELFYGEKAIEAKQRAQNIARLMLFKISQ